MAPLAHVIHIKHAAPGSAQMRQGYPNFHAQASAAPSPCLCALRAYAPARPGTALSRLGHG